MGYRYTHTNINSPDWRRLCDFYINVFDCKIVPPERHLYGEWFEKACGMKGAEVHGAHIALPGYPEGGPTLEIFTHTIKGKESSTAFNDQGMAHLAIHVDDVAETFRKFCECGGSSDGEIVNKYYDTMDRTLTMIYGKDPDGNIVEIQHWSDGDITK